jgi:hypothetical protein
MATIAILDIHDGYGDETWFYENFTYSKLSDELKEYIHFIKIKSINEIFNLFNVIGITPDKLVGIADVDYNESYVYQTIYTQTDKVTDTNFNKLGTQILRDINVCGKMILIKRSLTDESYVDFTLSDFIMLVRNVFVRDAIQIDSKGNCKPITYINDVLEAQIYKDTYENIRYYEHKLLDYTLTFYVNKSEVQTEENLNLMATVIYGKKIYGKVTITLLDYQDEHPRCINLTEKNIKEIFHLYKNKITIDRNRYTKKISMDDINLDNTLEITSDDRNIIKGFPNITLNPNFFSIISAEYYRYKNENLEIDLNQFNNLQID